MYVLCVCARARPRRHYMRVDPATTPPTQTNTHAHTRAQFASKLAATAESMDAGTAIDDGWDSSGGSEWK